MRIKDERVRERIVEFQELRIGDGFEHEDCIHIKINNNYGFDTENDEVVAFDEEVCVTPVCLQIVVT